jgi:C1A family cysteine protease
MRKLGMGWRPDLPDQRDFTYAAKVPAPERGLALPKLVDLRTTGLFPAVYDQGGLGSCTANAIAAAIQVERKRQNLLPDFVPSRLFIYWYERMLENTIAQDAGAELRDGMKCIGFYGAPPESQWPYDEMQFTDRPSVPAIKAAKLDHATAYLRLNNTNLAELRQCLAAGYPFVFGFTVYESFMSDAVAASGVAPMPQETESVVGGHAVMAVGYDAVTQTFQCRNSWGGGWGSGGYFTIPFGYLTNSYLADDFWTLRRMSP